MGLPIWREPEPKPTTDAPLKASFSGVSRIRTFSTRNRAGPQWDRTTAAHAQRQYRQRNLYSPRLDLPSTERSEGTNDDYAGIPPISTLLETADRASAPVPPPVPEPRNFLASERRGSSVDDQDAVIQSGVRRVGESSWSPPTSTVGERMRLIEETNRVVTSLGVQTEQGIEPMLVSTGRANISTPSSEDSQSPSIGTTGFLRREDALRQLLSTRIDGLGDRNRSPTPADGWETMRSTIQPDTNLPSAESSFTSTVASQSFTSSSASTTPTDDVSISQENVLNQSISNPDDDTASSIGPGDVCAEDDDSTLLGETESLAREMYYQEMRTPEGRERIAEQQAVRAREGNRYGMSTEPASVDIGFRLIEAALERIEERHRTLRLRGQSRTAADYGPDLARLSEILDQDRLRQAHPDSVPGQAAEMSQDAPQAHPVSLPQPVTEESVIANIERGEQDLDAMRQIVELLASRDDIEDEWWMSMGLNFSRPRPNRRSHTAAQHSTFRDSRVVSDLNRVRNGRVERMRDDTRGSRL